VGAGVIETAIAADAVATEIETSAKPVAVSVTTAGTVVAIETVIVDPVDRSRTPSLPRPRTSGVANVRMTASVADVRTVAETSRVAKTVVAKTVVAMRVVVVIARSAARARPNAPQRRLPPRKTPRYPSRARRRPLLKQAATL
jgi:hypothetical protein